MQVTLGDADDLIGVRLEESASGFAELNVGPFLFIQNKDGRIEMSLTAQEALQLVNMIEAAWHLA